MHCLPTGAQPIADCMFDSEATMPRDPILDQLLAGDSQAQSQWVGTHQRAVFSVISRVLHRRAGPAECEELAQEAFLRAFRNLSQFDPEGPGQLRTWLLSIASHLAIDRCRQLARRSLRESQKAPPLEQVAAHLSGRVEAGFDPCAGHSDLEAEISQRQLAAAVEAAVEQLDPSFRAAFVLRAYHQLDYAEIAEILELDRGTVKSRISRARAKIRTRLRHLLEESRRTHG